ncbi:MAG: SprB repeat-containing protein, partial [Bacteroidota bacterium]|nr:SprB repeat-containing protein [Bacteroidota bacterium]
VSGGVAPYAFAWDNGELTEDISGLSAGTYTVTVTDANFCEFVASYTITEPTAITVSEILTDVLCNGEITGAIDLTVSGGVAPYAFAWDNGELTEDISGLSAGTYTVTVTDANFCEFVSIYTVTEPLVIEVAEVIIDETCVTGNDGIIEIMVVGGTYPFTFEWSNGSTNEDLIGVSTGTYYLTVTDANGCEYQNSYFVGLPVQVNLSGAVSDITCYGAADGLIDLTVNSGTAPFSFNWSNGEITEDISNLIIGTYTVTVIDANSCSSTSTFTISQPSIFEANAQVTSNYNGYSVSCFGSSTGEVSVLVSGGQTPYNYLWSNGSTDTTLTNVGAGTYTLTLTDANGCQAIQDMQNGPVVSWNVIQTTESHVIMIPATAIVDIDGVPASNGDLVGVFYDSLGTLACGGFSPYDGNSFTIAAWAADAGLINGFLIGEEFSWKIKRMSDGVTVDAVANYTTVGVTDTSSFAIDGLSAISSLTGTEIIPVPTDITVTLFEPDSITLDITISDFNGYGVSCITASDGSIVIVAQGGAGTYTYLWEDNSTLSFRNNLGVGTYFVTVTDINGCQTVGVVNLNSPPSFNASINILSDFNGYSVSCFGSNDGQVEVNSTGGVPPYSYSWAGGETTQGLSGLSAGVYNVTVTDSNGCTAFSVSTSSGNVAWDFTISGTNHTILVQSSAVLAIDGNPISNGDYIGVFYDSLGTDVCAGFIEWQGITTTVVAYGSDAGQNNGFASGEAFNWKIFRSSDSTTVDAVASYSNIVAPDGGQFVIDGISEVTVIEGTEVIPANTDIFVELIQPSEISLNIAVSDFLGYGVSCFGGNDGSIVVVAIGGMSPYTFNWNNGSTDQFVSNIAAGDYTVSVTDANLCETTSLITITEPIALTLSESTSDILCSGDLTGAIDITVTDGVTPYSYVWDNGELTEDLTGLAAGTYNVVVTDANGCTVNESIVIIELYPIYNTVDDATICEGESYVFGTQTLTLAGIYTEVFTSALGCDSTVDLTLNVNPVYNTVDDATICEGESYVFGTQTLTLAG